MKISLMRGRLSNSIAFFPLRMNLKISPAGSKPTGGLKKEAGN
jgi:hypothetical protein